MKYSLAYLAFVFTVVLLFGFAYSINPDGSDAKKIFIDKKCNSCHSVESVLIESKKKGAYDLSEAGNKFNADFLAKYLSRIEKIDDKEHKISFKGTDEEIKILTEWLSSLKVEKSR